MWPFGRRRRLADLAGPTELTVDAIVATPNDVVSPLSGQRAAVILVQLLRQVEPYLPQRSPFGGSRYEAPPAPREAYAQLARFVQGSRLVLDLATPSGGEPISLELSVPEVGLVLAPGSLHASLVPHPPPDVLRDRVEAARAAAAGEPLWFREQVLLHDTAVTVSAIFDVLPRTQDAYRGAGARRIVARPDLGPVLVQERVVRGW